MSSSTNTLGCAGHIQCLIRILLLFFATLSSLLQMSALLNVFVLAEMLPSPVVIFELYDVITRFVLSTVNLVVMRKMVWQNAQCVVSTL